MIRIVVSSHHLTLLVKSMGLIALLDSVRVGKERCGGDDLGAVNVSATTVLMGI